MKILGLIAAGLACATQAYAADLPTPVAPVLIEPIVPTTWDGCYGGGFGAFDIARVRDTQSETQRAHVVSRSQNETSTTIPTAATPLDPQFGRLSPVKTTFTTTNTTTTVLNKSNIQQQTDTRFGRTFTGADGGARLGCNYQSGRFVVGAQIEGGYLGVNGSINNPFRTTSISAISGGAYTAASAKIGYAIFDRTLIFVRGGIGTADLRYSTYDNTVGYRGSIQGTQAMPLVGAGLEYKLTPQLSVTAEYTYLMPRCRSANYTAPTTQRIVGNEFVSTTGDGTTSSCINKQMISLGLNYYFNAPPVPVVARY